MPSTVLEPQDAPLCTKIHENHQFQIFRSENLRLVALVEIVSPYNYGFESSLAPENPSGSVSKLRVGVSHVF